jgi:hypothetical protein
MSKDNKHKGLNKDTKFIIVAVIIGILLWVVIFIVWYNYRNRDTSTTSGDGYEITDDTITVYTGDPDDPELTFNYEVNTVSADSIPDYSVSEEEWQSWEDKEDEIAMNLVDYIMGNTDTVDFEESDLQEDEIAVIESLRKDRDNLSIEKDYTTGSNETMYVNKLTYYNIENNNDDTVRAQLVIYKFYNSGYFAGFYNETENFYERYAPDILDDDTTISLIDDNINSDLESELDSPINGYRKEMKDRVYDYKAFCKKLDKIEKTINKCGGHFETKVSKEKIEVITYMLNENGLTYDEYETYEFKIVYDEEDKKYKIKE